MEHIYFEMDMDLIEVLWKQDVDLGFSLDLFTPPKSPKLDEKLDKEHEPQDELEKLKALQASAAATEDADKNEDDILPTQDLDPWEGLPYTIDLETGECVLKPSIGDVLSDPSSVEELSNSSNTAVPGEQPSALIDLPLFSLEEALQLVGLDEESTQNTPSDKELSAEEHKAPPPVVVVPSPSEEEGEKVEKQQQLDSDEEPSLLSDMIQTAQFHHPHPHPRAFQFFCVLFHQEEGGVWAECANSRNMKVHRVDGRRASLSLHRWHFMSWNMGVLLRGLGGRGSGILNEYLMGGSK